MTWSFISEMMGSMTTVIPGNNIPANWYISDFPPPVGNSTMAGSPASRRRIALRLTVPEVPLPKDHLQEAPHRIGLDLGIAVQFVVKALGPLQAALAMAEANRSTDADRASRPMRRYPIQQWANPLLSQQQAVGDDSVIIAIGLFNLADREAIA